MTSSLLRLGDIIWGGTEEIIAFLHRNGLLASNRARSGLLLLNFMSQYIASNHVAVCRCNAALQERDRDDVSDGVSWYCQSEMGASSQNPSLVKSGHCFFIIGFVRLL